MIKSIHVRESMVLLWEAFQMSAFTNKASPAAGKAFPRGLREIVTP